MAKGHTMTRTDDAFLRRAFWIMLGLLLGSAGGWIWTVSYLQSEVDNANQKIEILEKTQKTISKSMHSIDKGVAVLVSMANIRNELLEEKNKNQEKINEVAALTRKEQKGRLVQINWVKMKMAEERR